MAEDLLGRFYFKKTINGNLIGEFSNNFKNCGIYTESATLTKGKNKSYDDDYTGSYHSTWCEGAESIYADLEIQKREDNHKIFTLKWQSKDGLNFKGEGMLCDNILIGDYQVDK